MSAAQLIDSRVDVAVHHLGQARFAGVAHSSTCGWALPQKDFRRAADVSREKYRVRMGIQVQTLNNIYCKRSCNELFQACFPPDEERNTLIKCCNSY